MELYQIKRRLSLAIEVLRLNDNYLLINDVNERSISHKLATYMEQTFGKTFDIDCEYNRNIGDIKKISILKSKWDELNNYPMITEDEILCEKKVFPDIIVHKRGKSDKNLLIIEVKKSTSTVSEDYDIEKLKYYTSSTNDLNYKFGAFIKFYTAKERYKSPEIRYFCDGKEVHKEIRVQGNYRI
ncbi:hypothetical protein [Anaerocolumna jejuensis]|uniref:hypothetical protein n=1 Tax=Anaerocolumna jejuensis TaxID=259063 RepID=UPI003F7BF3F0